MATFGNTVIGGGSGILDNALNGSYYSAPSGGEVTKLTAYIQPATTGQKFKCAIYSYNSAGDVGSPITNGITNEVTPGVTTAGWVDFTFSVNPSVVGGVNYYLVVWGTSVAGDGRLYSSGSGLNRGFVKTQSYGTFPSPITGESANNTTYCVYATYTPTGGSIVVSPTVTSIVASIGAIAIITSQLLSPSAITLNSSIPSPSIQAGNSAYQPIGLLLALTKQANGSLVSPSPSVASFQVQSPTVVTGQRLSIGVKSLTFSLPPSTATSPSEFFVSAFEATFNTNPVTITTEQIISPAVKSVTFSIPTVIVAHNGIATASAKSLTFIIPEVTLIVKTNALIEPSVVSASFNTQAPSFVTNNTLSITANTATFSLQNETISIRVAVQRPVKTLTFSLNTVSLVTVNRLAIPVRSLTFSIPTPQRTGGFYTDKYQDRNTSFGDKYTARNTTYSNKHSARNTSYNDKYTKLNL
jgi:hypothetical protein